MAVLEATGDIRKVSLGGFNLSLILPKRLGAGTPRELKKPGRGARFMAFLVAHMPVSPPIELGNRELAASWQLRVKTAPKDPDAGTSGIYALPPQAAIQVQKG
jgi:hypothetical protein